MLIIIGYLSGKETLRRLHRWSIDNEDKLKEYLHLKGGIPSLATMSRMVCTVDKELLTSTFINWIGSIVNTRGTHIAIDGKALRGAAEKLKDKKAPYILNAIDVNTKLVVAQLDIPEKTNEMKAIPKLLDLIDITGSTITIDAIGAAENILNKIHDKAGYFVQQIKKNCPATYQEIMDLFEGLKSEKEKDAATFNKKYAENYDVFTKDELNRDRYEYRTMERYCKDESTAEIRKEIPCICCVGLSSQIRIPKEVDENGSDITPDKTEYMRHGSLRNPRPASGDNLTDEIQYVGIISNKDYTAKELADYRRAHWSVENSLHYVLDESFLEDKCSSKKGKIALSVLRKFAYNIIRLVQMKEKYKNTAVIHVMDNMAGKIGEAAQYLFEPTLSFY